MTSSGRPRIAVIHATPKAVAPAVAALREQFPEAESWNIIDDHLLTDAAAAGGLSTELTDRMLRLIAYAVDEGAAGVLLSCSMYGPAAVEARTRHAVPILGSDEALFEAVAASRPKAVLVLGPLDTAVRDSVERLTDAIAERGGPVPRVLGTAVPEATEAVLTGNTSTAASLLADAARPHLDGVDLIVLGQFSISPARQELEQLLGVPVFSPPARAAAALRANISTSTEARQ
jgi:Asp/Glu/hydantoin racemase